MIAWLMNIIGKLIKIQEPLPVGYIPPPVELPIPAPPIVLPAIVLNGDKQVFDPQNEFNKPALWKYYPKTSCDIWVARNYQDYIIPDNKIVKYFIENIEFEEKQVSVGHPAHIETFLGIKYKDTNTLVEFKYRIDDAGLCRESGQEYRDCYELHDFWMNPDYYIWNKCEGDCDDYALLMASVFEGINIPYMFVTGYYNGIRDFWIEFEYNSKMWLAQVNLHNGSSARPINHVRRRYTPYEMFNKSTTIRKYEKWYN